MLQILIALICATVLTIVVLKISDDNMSAFGFIVGTLMVLLVGCTSIGYCIGGWSWFASEYKANIINREYGTDYTREEIFYASDVINTIRELDRKRVEINGNILKDK